MLNLQHGFGQFQKKVGSNHSTMILKHPTVNGLILSNIISIRKVAETC